MTYPSPFLTRELHACARTSYRYDVGNSTRSLARSILGFSVHLIVFGEQ